MCAVEALKARGFVVRVEKERLGFPFTPTLSCTRDHTTLIVEVDSQWREEKVNSWLRYCQSAGADTRFALCLPSHPAAEIQTRAQALGVGILLSQPPSLPELVTARDANLGVALPERKSLPTPVKRRLGAAYDKFDKAEWREGFEEAAQALETEARSYLKRWCKTGRIQVMTKTGPATLSSKQINKLTMGQLKDRFRQVVSPNSLDALVRQALEQINKDRIGVAHHRKNKKTEDKLRKNVGKHMYAIIDVLKRLL